MVKINIRIPPKLPRKKGKARIQFVHQIDQKGQELKHRVWKEKMRGREKKRKLPLISSAQKSGKQTA